MKGKILFFPFLSLFLFPGLAWGYQVTDIQAQDLEKETRIIIITDCPKYESFVVSGPDRLVIDLEADLLWPGSILEVNKGAVTKVWASPYQYESGRQVARVIIGLAQTPTYRINRMATGLMIDIAHPALKKAEAPEKLPKLKPKAPPEKIEIARRKIKKIKEMGKGRNIGKGSFKVETSYEWDKRDLIITSGKDGAGEYDKATIEGLNCRYDHRLKRDLFWVKGTYGITDFLDVFTKLGGVRSRYDRHDMTGVNDSTLNTNYDFRTWGTGLKVNIYEWPNGIYINSGFEYLRGKHKNKTFYVAGWKNDTDLEWEEWIGRIESGWIIRRFTPYLGVQYSDFEAKLDVENPAAWEYTEYGPIENWGGFYGLDVQLPKDFQINYESHFGDKESYILSVGYKFNFKKVKEVAHSIWDFLKEI